MDNHAYSYCDHKVCKLHLNKIIHVDHGHGTLGPNTVPLGQYVLRHNWEKLMGPCEEQGGDMRRHPSIEDLLVHDETDEVNWVSL